MRRLLLATRNAKKLTELQRMLGTDVTILGLDDVRAFPEEPETGATFAENAIAKAEQAARETGEIALADDSGFCVDALNGMPGVLSARWSGRHGDDPANNALLLAQLADVPDDRRRARFTCVLAVAEQAGSIETCTAGWPGHVQRQTRGSNGFGYDPLFLPDDGGGLSAAELEPAVKDRLSHRGQALRLMVAVLPRILR